MQGSLPATGTLEPGSVSGWSDITEEEAPDVLVTTGIGDGLLAALMWDRIAVTADTMKTWGVSIDEAMATAIANIDALEQESRVFNEAIEAVPRRMLSAGNFVEVSIVVEATTGATGIRELDRFLETAGIEVVDVDRRQAMEARRAFELYGKGRHPAGLNFGDCFAYALAKIRAQPLLYKGGDFSETDLLPVT